MTTMKREQSRQPRQEKPVVLRARVPIALKEDVLRIAERRQSSESQVVREACAEFIRKMNLSRPEEVAA